MFRRWMKLLKKLQSCFNWRTLTARSGPRSQLLGEGFWASSVSLK